MNAINLNIGVNGGFLAPVLVLDITDKETDYFNRAIVKAGGFGVVAWSDKHADQLEEVREIFRSSNDQRTKEIAEALTLNQPVIFVAKQIADGIGEREVLAMLFHEEGHIVNEDWKLEPGENGYIFNDEIELNADAHSAKKNGKDAMANAIRKIPALIGAAFLILGEPQEEVDNFLLSTEEILKSSPHFQKRLAALS